MITLDNVSKQYKSSARPALDNVSVKIDKGEFVFLIGPSGSGKSTFMRLLLAEEQPSSGDIRVSKFHLNKLPGRHVSSLRQVLGCVFQDFRLLQQKSVFENVAFALEVIGKRSDTINRVVPEVLEMVADPGAPITRAPLMDLRLPRGILVGAVVGQRVEIATGQTVVTPGARTLVFATPERVDEVERLFAA